VPGSAGWRRSAVDSGIAEGANPTDALLEGFSRDEILDWLQEEFDGLLMHGFEPLPKNAGLERNNAEILFRYLEKTKAEKSPGLKFEVEPVGNPEELGAEGKYYQEIDVTIRYEGVELGSCVLESEGEYISGKWVGESAQWPTLLQGLVPLPRVAIDEPRHQRQEVARIEERETKAEPREISGLSHSAPSAGLLDVIKAYDDIVDRPEARKQLQQTNPGLVAARDQAVVQEKRERLQEELAARSARQSNSRRR